VSGKINLNRKSMSVGLFQRWKTRGGGGESGNERICVVVVDRGSGEGGS